MDIVLVVHIIFSNLATIVIFLIVTNILDFFSNINKLFKDKGMK